MEPRGCIADYDPGTRRYTLYTSTQNVHGVRQTLAHHILHVPERVFTQPGSVPAIKTIGVVVVTPFAASGAGVPLVPGGGRDRLRAPAAGRNDPRSSGIQSERCGIYITGVAQALPEGGG
jgi:hypothetical protein